MKYIKSKERVKEKGEVFTRKREIKAMLKNIPNITKDTVFLEPSCGNGNFLIEILKNKLRTTDKKTEDLLSCLQSIYGVDIMEDNIIEARLRLLKYIERLGYINISLLVENILKNNIKIGDFLKDDMNKLFGDK